MMHQIIDRLRATSSSNAKKEILREVLSNHEDNICSQFIMCARIALDPFVTFGIKKVPTATHSNPSKDNVYVDFTDMLFELQTRQLTGNAAVDAVNNMADSIEADLWNGFYRRILLKNLDCGVNLTTWNNVAKEFGSEYTVKKFSCQLASSKEISKLSGDYIIEYKLDGIRCLTVVDPSGKVEMFTRNGKVLTNFTKIAEQFSEYAQYLSEPTVFDGEIMSSSFQDLMKQVHRKQDVQTDDALYYVFDMIPKNDFYAGECVTSQYDRTWQLRQNIGFAHNAAGMLSQVRNVELLSINLDSDEGLVEFDKFNRRAIDQGFEGVILKAADAPYKTTRSDSWVKVKPVIEVTLEVKDVAEGTGKYTGTTGAILCEGTDDGTYISVHVGSGLSDVLRDQIWQDRDSVIGQLVEITADAVTQNQDGSYSLRFPRFKTFRGFEPGEKL